MLAQPPGSVNGQLRLTEQGEVIASKYADPIVGGRNLGDAGGGDDGGDAARRRRSAATTRRRSTRRWRSCRRTRSRAYRGLVYETPGFIDYFRAATPINEIGDLNIGSRPASRKSSDRIEDLRAIPWVFSWGQSPPEHPRLLRLRRGGEAVPGRRERRASARLAALRAMYARWPFFRTLVDKLDMVLAKIDMGIAARYAALVADRKLRKTVFGRIEREHDDTLRGVLRDHGDARRCSQNNPSLARSLRNRIPYIDPLNHLQVDLLRRLRSGQGRRRRAPPRRPPHHQRRRRRPPQQRLGEVPVSLAPRAGRGSRERGLPVSRRGDRNQRMAWPQRGRIQAVALSRRE